MKNDTLYYIISVIDIIQLCNNVELEPSVSGIELNLESAVIEQFGEAIRSAVLDVINEMNISDVKIKVVDRGALDCVIRARVETALSRGMEAHDA